MSASADVFPNMREFERWTTTAVNAFTQPMFDRYLERLETGLAGQGFRGRLYIMSSSGGTLTADTARRYPVRALESGPAAGALMSAYHGRSLDLPNLLSFDMGGTTAKGAIVRGGTPIKRYSMEVARVHEFRQGSGLPIRIPVIDMIEIGAGGGSIADIDDRGLLRVGPRSAGADPGPACYGRGGARPTLTDANLVLGYLDAGFFLGGAMALDRPAAEAAIRDGVAKPLGLETLRTAWGIHDIVSEDVARAFRIHASERGFDYRSGSMVAFGGSGPLHAMAIARKLKIPRVVFPVGAGVMSALGLLISPLAFELARSRRIHVADIDAADFAASFQALEREAKSYLLSAGVPEADIQLKRRLDMRYQGQGHEIEVTLPDVADSDALFGQLEELFGRAYQAAYTLRLDEPAEIVTWKVEATGPAPNLGSGYTLSGPAGTGSSPQGYAACLRSRQRQAHRVAGVRPLRAGTRRHRHRTGADRGAGEHLRDRRRQRGDRRCPLQSRRRTGLTGESTMSDKTFDPVSLGIMWDRLISIVDEIVSTLVRTSFSTIVNESYDLTCVVLDAEANSIAQGTFSVPVFIGSAPITLRHMLKRYPAETLKPGDVIITNDPWLGTGHLYDITMVRPVFRQGRVVAYTLSISHLPDIGGSGFGSSATEVYHEGLRLPICKLYEEGRLNELLMEIIRTNVRVPEQVIGDVMANVACNEVGGREILAFMDEYGLDDLTALSAGHPRAVGGGDARQDPRAWRGYLSQPHASRGLRRAVRLRRAHRYQGR